MAATPRRSAAARLGSAVTTAAAVVVILGCAVWLLPTALGLDRYVITGGSMSGTFEKGSIAFEERVPVDRLRVGDVITYQPPAGSGTSTLVTHRIVAIRSGEDGLKALRTKGDANDSEDPWRFSLTGSSQPVVRFTVPYAGWAFIWLADRQLRMLIIGVPAALVALVALRDLVRALRRPRASGPAEAAIPAQVARRPLEHETTA